MAHGPAEDPAQHVAAALVRGEDAVREEERGGPGVVGEHVVRVAGGRLELVRLTDHLHAHVR